MPSPSRRFRNGERSSACEDSSYRSLSLRSSSLDIESRSIEADISTETPVMMPDWSRGEMVPEVLVASGAQIPKSRQVPFLDSHQRSSVADQLGSARNIEVQGNRLTARLHFSEAAGNEFTKVREGHVTDVSVGYEVLKRQFVAKGDTKQIDGREYSGPVNVVTKWRLREVSLTPIGADAQAKLRGLDPAAFRFRSSEERPFAMNKALRKLLESKGMPATYTDEEAQRWLVENPTKLAESQKQEQRPDEQKPAERGLSAQEVGSMLEEAVRKAIANQNSERAAFHKTADTLCDLADLPDLKEQARALANEDAVRSFLVEQKSKRSSDLPSAPSIRVTGDGFGRMQSDIKQVISTRAMQNAGAKPDYIAKFYAEGKNPNAQQWRHATPFEMARELVQASGVDVRGLSREEIALCALFGSQKIGLDARSGGAYHTTGSFTAVTLDAVNKSVGVGYTETPSTWRGPMRQGSSVVDFKDKHTIRMGAVPNLPVWNDNVNPEKASFADAKVTYAVEARSLEVNYSYRLLVNDDLDALSRTPSQMGAAAARTVNSVAWAQITSNPTMAYDSVALFSAASGNRKRQNLTTGAGAPSVTTVGALTSLMRQMRGENTPENAEGADILNLQPRYIVGGSALETVINQLVNSAYDPSSSVNNQVYNPTRTLVPVIEPLLDANSATAWYLFADPSQIDTVEVSFLQGQETPVTRQFMDERTLSQSFIILQSFAAKAINHRGIQKHAGA